MSRYPKHTLTLEQWPTPDRAMWDAVFAEGDILDGRGPGANWAPTTRESTFRSYGKWLTWLAMNTILDNYETPLDRITPDRVRAYISDLNTEAASQTVMHHVLNLLLLAQAAAPKRDWRWLRGIQNRLKVRARPVRDKAPKLRSAQELFDLGIRLMETADHASRRYSLEAPLTQYRDGLIIALLAARPIRLKNLTAVTIGRHLTKVGDTYWLRFDGSEIKNGKPIDVPLPRRLAPYIDSYLTEWRPTLLGNHTSDRMCISTRGNALSAKSHYWRITRRTKVAFGIEISPHLFRDCAATSVAIEDPGHVHITASILGHTTLTTSQKYYNQAHMLEAGRAVQLSIVTLRNNLRAEARGPYKTLPQRS
ncbi:MAG: site-specific integrase [Rhodospirillaceae bacterium]|jgi:integrase/recombinase XerD|nr:site-specific integrase [Rhodospirillaceae bacterium]MBT5033567.1 site-specific integrase [Rhodospirillaceae bacterium]MBT6218129.1 site-specific integrase [Rhodospirillaceae bacterium]